mmetsp:Transcript_56189/g.180363  ORF Transcript_56189/g.180363 Transcript_56189/m.180363 type:complete len:244 (-) Transcript_56189:420-1151(-)
MSLWWAAPDVSPCSAMQVPDTLCGFGLPMPTTITTNPLAVALCGSSNSSLSPQAGIAPGLTQQHARPQMQYPPHARAAPQQSAHNGPGSHAKCQRTPFISRRAWGDNHARVKYATVFPKSSFQPNSSSRCGSLICKTSPLRMRKRFFFARSGLPLTKVPFVDVSTTASASSPLTPMSTSDACLLLMPSSCTTTSAVPRAEPIVMLCFDSPKTRSNSGSPCFRGSRRNAIALLPAVVVLGPAKP